MKAPVVAAVHQRQRRQVLGKKQVDKGVHRASANETLVVLGLVSLCGVLVYPLLHIGWVPSDEGTLAQSALRVYAGQLPHRDFAEIYTGGLAFLHAFSFRLFGVNLFSLRISVFALFLAWVPAVYRIARRFSRPPVAATVTLTAVAWSYPNYVTAMPSWYNLFFATFGALALMRFLEAPRAGWLFLAGVFGGLSLDVKIIGLYYIAAALLFLLFYEQASAMAAPTAPVKTRRPWLYQAACGTGLLLYLAGLIEIVRPQLHGGGVYHYVLPSFACVALLLWRERGPCSRTSLQRAVTFSRLAMPFFCGVLAGCMPLLAPYLLTGSTHALVHGVFGSTVSRVAGLGGRLQVPGLAAAPYGIVTLCLLLGGLYSKRRWRRWAVLTTALVLFLVLVFSAFPSLPVQDTWLMGGMLTPAIVVFGAFLLAFRLRERGNELRQGQLMLLIALAAVCSLVQYPVPWVTYFCYTAPLTLLATLAVIKAHGSPAEPLLLRVTLWFFLGFGIFGLVAKHVYDPEMQVTRLHRLNLPRAGGLKVDRATQGYEELTRFLQAHSDNGELYAGNDCPELYFLSGLHDPTRDDTGAPPSEVLAALRSGNLHLIALNDQPFFASGAIPQDLRRTISEKLPHRTVIGRFSVYWR